MAVKYKEECVFCCVDHDMGATIPTCMYDYDYDYGSCPCDICGHFVDHKTARRIVREQLERIPHVSEEV